jgi:hypothetical protein
MFFESLETRALMSVSAVSLGVEEARLVVQQDLLNLKADCIQYTNTLLQDCQALQAADLKQDKVLVPLFKQLRSDVKSMQSQLKSDRLTECEAVLKDESAILLVKESILADQGNPTEEKADHIQLVTDQIQLQNDEIAGLNTRIATREADYGTLFDDLANIATALGTDTGASPALVEAVTKFDADRGDALTDILGDLQALQGARTSLAVALTAELGAL